MAALPYMRFYPADYLADAAHLTATQHGIYMLLIMNYWQRGGPLPNDDARLARIAKCSMRDWRRNRPSVSEFFTVVDNHWRHKRIDAELTHVNAKSLKSKEAAQASVERRFGKRSTNVEPTDTEADTNTEEKEVSNDTSSAREIWAYPPCPVDKQIWRDFKKNRSKKRLPNTATAFKGLRNDLARISAATGISETTLLQHAAAKGWGAIYDPNERKVNGHGRSEADRTLAAAEDAFGPASEWTDDHPF